MHPRIGPRRTDHPHLARSGGCLGRPDELPRDRPHPFARGEAVELGPLVGDAEDEPLQLLRHNSAICTALRAAPLRIWSPTTHSWRTLSPV